MKKFIRSIVNILKYAGRFFTIIRNTFFNLLFLAFVIVVAFTFFASQKKPEVALDKNSILRLDIYGDIVEEKKILSSLEMLLEDPVFGQSRPKETLLQDILDAINTSASDEQIEVILLNLKQMGRAGLNQLETIGAALNNFKKTGKKVIAAEDYYTQSQYFLASYADTISINPMGGVEIRGLGVYRLYFKEAMDSLKINYNIFKVGSYKSALEPFTRTGMSPQAEQQNEVWLAKLWQNFSGTITTNRDISTFQLRRYTDNIALELAKAKGSTAQLALNTGLVDNIFTRAQVKTYLQSLSHATGDTLPVTSTRKYLATTPPSYWPDGGDRQNIGIIIAEGNILPGKRPSGMIGGDSVAALVDKARVDRDIKALVLRINSGGGSAFASEIIRQSLLEFKKTGKPLVVSMGSVAASGGYWIAADADEIWAANTTITGSIGIFGAIPTFEKSLESLGIYSDGIGTTPLAAGLNLTRPLSEPIKDSIQQNIEYNYKQFLEIVSKGRGLDIESVARLAEGRVYDGQTAKRLGLVDNIGSLDEVIEAAAKLADLSDYEPRYIQKPSSVKDQLFQYFTTSLRPLVLTIDSQWLKTFTDVFSAHTPQLLSLDDPAGVYAVCEISPFLR